MMCDQNPAIVTGHFTSELVLNPRVYLHFSLSSLRLSGSIHHKTFAECLDISAASAVVETQGQIQIPHQTRLQLSAHFQCKKGERNDLFFPVHLNNKKERVPQQFFEWLMVLVVFCSFLPVIQTVTEFNTFKVPSSENHFPYITEEISPTFFSLMYILKKFHIAP